MFSQFGWKTLLELGNSDAHVAPPPPKEDNTKTQGRFKKFTTNF